MMSLFFLKKLIGILIMPLGVVLILLLLAIILSKHHRKLSQGLLLSSFLILLTCSTPYFSGRFMEPFENNYATFNKQIKPLDYIVILGCGHTSNDKLPAIAQLQSCSLQRLTEGLRILQLHPEARLVTSGYAATGNEPNAIKVKQAAMSLGVAEEKIISFQQPQDTEQEAEIISKILIDKQFALVTNASHMPRAMKYFIKQSTHPIPAPTGFRYKGEGEGIIENLPVASSLQRTSLAWYEALGQIIQGLKD